ncbi:hypothetical protein M011DRAFT_473257 [Sporormia fimetaria CBS 119925]|uniref:Myb-like domain-containing protein n=1 Tax=Sporormia fimetaria CBS 119925 TaxID=1340428 RepID=A0A6A6VQA3_9PLEO|nr:hypothetical protein M011DRAFT_473257 [Sporormia fimetaria CBS 119925]
MAMRYQVSMPSFPTTAGKAKYIGEVMVGTMDCEPATQTFFMPSPDNHSLLSLFPASNPPSVEHPVTHVHHERGRSVTTSGIAVASETARYNNPMMETLPVGNPNSAQMWPPGWPSHIPHTQGDVTSPTPSLTSKASDPASDTGSYPPFLDRRDTPFAEVMFDGSIGLGYDFPSSAEVNEIVPSIVPPQDMTAWSPPELSARNYNHVNGLPHLNPASGQSYSWGSDMWSQGGQPVVQPTAYHQASSYAQGDAKRLLPDVSSTRISGQECMSSHPVPQSSQREQVSAASTASRRKMEDQVLLEGKKKGLTYKEIKKQLGGNVAESTLRGRYRSLTKPRKDRVRKPVWTDRDIALLRKTVEAELDKHDATCYNTSREHRLAKVSWKKVAENIKLKGGSYHFGNSTCKKKWRRIERGYESDD